MLRLRTLAGASALLGVLVSSASSQVLAPPSELLSYHHDSGPVANTAARPEVVISFPVVVQDSPWVRLTFSEVELSGDVFAGTGSILRMTAVRDGAVQEMNAVHVQQWRQTSAYFNGDMVLVEVLAQPGTGTNRVVLEAVTAGDVPSEDSQCGSTDDRVLSSDPRAGRIMPIGCTGWMIDDCSSCLLTAGHCDGNVGVVQFNVPLSTSGGGLVSPPPEDQYAVDSSSLQSNGGQGTGNDWAYFGCFPNTNTGLTPFEGQGARYTLSAAPAFSSNESIRITGYGADSTPQEQNQVQQTHVGPWVTSTSTLVQYVTDTEGGNSGSPVIHEQTGHAIGIHTHGGCSTTGTGENSGTASTHPGLQAALAAPMGVCEGSVSVVSELPSLLTPGVPVSVAIQTSGTMVPGSATLYVRMDGGGFVPQTMTDAGGGLFQGTLLAGTCADTPEYFFSVTHVTCGALTTPGNAPASSYDAMVGSATELFSDDFEQDLGWTTLISGATSGQWERGVPVDDASWAYDPAGDSDGSGQAFVTQNQLGNTDVDDGAVQLESPDIDMSMGNVVVSYDYFLNLTNEDGADRLLVTASDAGAAGSFVEVARHDTGGGLAWRSHALTEADLAAAGLSLTANMRLRFTTNDGDPQSINESGLDAFDVSEVVCGEVGQGYCSSNGAVITATGSASVAAGDLILEASGLPAGKPGIFIYSMTQQAVPFGAGTRCVGPSKIFRLQPLLTSNGAGTMTKAVDYAALVPSGQILPGQIWHFQAWFRSGGSFDLTDGRAISFVQ